MSMNIKFITGQPLACLVTGARMPASLALCRMMKKSGARVFAVDSIRHAPSKYSHSVEQYFRVPSPRKQPRQFIDAIARICDENGITLLLPMYEESFVVSEFKPELQSRCKDLMIFVDEASVVSRLHNKYRFNSYCMDLDVKTPATCLLRSGHDLAREVSRVRGEFVLKPVYSRFAARVLINPSAKQLAFVRPSDSEPWILQERIRGKPSSSYGMAIDGKILAHATYDINIVIGANRRNGVGASLSYVPNHDLRPLQIAQAILGPLGYTGQFGFDFIADDQDIYCLECNPRATSGIHLLEDVIDMRPTLSGQPAMPRRLSSASNHLMLWYSLMTLSIAPWNRYLIQGFSCRDVLFRLGDPLPFVVMYVILLQQAFQALRAGISASELFLDDLTCDFSPAIEERQIV